MDRRTFHRLCGGLLGGASLLQRELAAASRSPSGPASPATSPPVADADSANPDSANAVATVTGPSPRSRLVRADETPLTLADLAPGDAWVFHYPYRTTPCFLIRLDTGGDTDAGTAFPDGLGDDGSVVAFSAICTHKMSHPARPISHIAYRPETVEFIGHDGTRERRGGLISCCSERSVYDPADGARVLGGPAPMPLAAIRLALDADGALVATASLGRDRYDDFLDAFGFRLAMEHGRSDVRQPSGETSVAVPAGEFSRQQIRC